MSRSNAELQAFYAKLLQSYRAPVFRDGEWQLCDRIGWPDNPSYQNVVAWAWTKDTQRYLVVVNLSGDKAEAQVKVPWPDAAGQTWALTDLLSGTVYERNGNDMVSPGLYVGLDAWGYNLFRCGAK